LKNTGPICERKKEWGARMQNQTCSIEESEVWQGGVFGNREVLYVTSGTCEWIRKDE
jgi:hypothetical protein